MHSVATAEIEIRTPHLPGPDWKCTHCHADIRRGEDPEAWPCVPAQLHILRAHRQSPYYVETWLTHLFFRAAHDIGNRESAGALWRRFFGYLPGACSREGLCPHRHGMDPPSLTITAARRTQVGAHVLAT